MTYYCLHSCDWKTWSKNPTAAIVGTYIGLKWSQQMAKNNCYAKVGEFLAIAQLIAVSIMQMLLWRFVSSALLLVAFSRLAESAGWGQFDHTNVYTAEKAPNLCICGTHTHWGKIITTTWTYIHLIEVLKEALFAQSITGKRSFAADSATKPFREGIYPGLNVIMSTRFSWNAFDPNGMRGINVSPLPLEWLSYFALCDIGRVESRLWKGKLVLHCVFHRLYFVLWQQDAKNRHFLPIVKCSIHKLSCNSYPELDMYSIWLLPKTKLCSRALVGQLTTKELYQSGRFMDREYWRATHWYLWIGWKHTFSRDQLEHQ